MSETNTADRFQTYPFSGAAADRCEGLTDSCTLTHTLDTETGKPLCRVKADNLLEDGLWDGEGCTARKPTCKTCAARDPRFAFKAQEIAYRKPGQNWKRTICKTQASFDRKIAQLRDDAAEIQTRDAA